MKTGTKAFLTTVLFFQWQAVLGIAISDSITACSYMRLRNVTGDLMEGRTVWSLRGE